MKNFGSRGLAILGFAVLAACTNEVTSFDQPEVLIKAQSDERGYNTAANLMATAIKETEQLDIVLYPRDLIERSRSAVLATSMDSFGRQRLMSVYPDDIQDQFKIGTMRGKDIKKLIEQRSSEMYRTEIDVAGLLYQIHFLGGYQQFAYFSRPEGQALNDREYYRVAISQLFWFDGLTFPSYKYRNGLNFSFRDLGRKISAKHALETYLATKRIWPDLKERRAIVTRSSLGSQGLLTIPQIQGVSHRSPYYAQTVTTQGVVTAVGNAQWYPGGVDVIIQSLTPDGDPRTAEGLLVYFEKDEDAPALGDVIEVRGTVYELVANSGLGMTGLREVTSLKTLRQNENLPEPVKLGRGGLAIPTDVISTWRGNLNLKPALDLRDGIDFWESLEGMRVEINSPRVVGFRGGQEDFESKKPKAYLTLYVRPDGDRPDPQDTAQGGLLVDFPRNDYNPHVLQISTNHLTAPIDAKKIFNVGELIKGQVDGVLIYQKNLFGDGDFNLVMPIIPKDIATAFSNAPSTISELSERPITKLKAGPDQLSVASFNVENLGGDQVRRLAKLAEALVTNLRCPDIINFVEIQDANGPSLLGSAEASKTLEKIIELTAGASTTLEKFLESNSEASNKLAKLTNPNDCRGKKYAAINIDPVQNAEGGQPGGNIRVAVMYDSSKIQFTPRANARALDETRITKDGHLSQNPGRIFGLDPLFDGVRRPLVTEYSFRGEQIILVGNHFNSKLGDTSVWDSVQPAYLRSEDKRIPLAEKLNDFVEYVLLKAPRAHIIMAGDFNALETETSMKVLEGRSLHNMTKLFLPPNKRYTTNYNGNSQAIDHIFVNDNLLKRAPQLEVLHINSDYMGRLSDHDPVLALFQF